MSGVSEETDRIKLTNAFRTAVLFTCARSPEGRGRRELSSFGLTASGALFVFLNLLKRDIKRVSYGGLTQALRLADVCQILAYDDVDRIS